MSETPAPTSHSDDSLSRRQRLEAHQAHAAHLQLPDYCYQAIFRVDERSHELLATLLEPARWPADVSASDRDRLQRLWQQFRQGRWNRERDLPVALQKLLAGLFHDGRPPLDPATGEPLTPAGYRRRGRPNGRQFAHSPQPPVA